MEIRGTYHRYLLDKNQPLHFVGQHTTLHLLCFQGSSFGIDCYSFPVHQRYATQLEIHHPQKALPIHLLSMFFLIGSLRQNWKEVNMLELHVLRSELVFANEVY